MGLGFVLLTSGVGEDSRDEEASLWGSVKMSLSLQAIRAESKSKEIEERLRTERRRNALILIMRHLVDHGYSASYEKLCSEAAPLSLSELDVADNINLGCILEDFENFYEIKYGRRAKLIRKNNSSNDQGGAQHRSTHPYQSNLIQSITSKVPGAHPASRLTHDSANQSELNKPAPTYLSGINKAKQMRERGQANLAAQKESRANRAMAKKTSSNDAASERDKRDKSNGETSSSPAAAEDGLGISIQGTGKQRLHNISHAVPMPKRHLIRIRICLLMCVCTICFWFCRGWEEVERFRGRFRKRFGRARWRRR